MADGDQPRIRAALGLLLASRHLEDLRRLELHLLEPAAGWVTFQAIGLLTGADRPRVLEDRVAAMRAPLLLISAGRAAEHDFGVLYEHAAGGPVEHWNLPDVEHTRGLRERPEEYGRRVATFFAATLTHPRKDQP